MDDLPLILTSLWQQAPVLVAAYDSFDRLQFANLAFRAAFFLGEDERPLWSEIMRRNFALQRGTVLKTNDFEQWLVATQSRRGKLGYRAFETDLYDGRWLWMTETVQSDGWMLCIASDVTDLRPDERAVRQARDFAIKASFTDELTGIANRRFVLARVSEMIAGASRREGVIGSVALLDLDHFKVVNDRFGHQTGDQILRDFAHRIQATVRRTDCFGRFGGEEFVLVMPDTDGEQAAEILGRMLCLIRDTRPIPEQPEFIYSFSAGIAVAENGDTAARLFDKADGALYAAKLAGRDCIRLHGQGLTDAPAIG
ncbi:diguanylate cyclase (GGDEF) domain-containing protein [Kaistia soli DSM 19436]|uniref:diguanylate cyclase n=1 Tax=Kaistia soli DSM 19436 TaxID=1122133 RepID=A0A1M5CNJ1_9HYPH|nr:GGDEF domain-containing protein [Kaistia soli]SHF56187.1 diguanylate cyclase (GGDEF) domain-containing protein [Kaistia soli DSM 19436]